MRERVVASPVRWRIIGVLLVLMSLTLNAGCLAGGSGGKGLFGGVSPALGKFLGERTVHVLSAPDAIETFQLRASLAPPPVPAVDGPDTVAGYLWKARGAPLAPAQIAEFRAIALDEKSYVFDTAKKCMLVPEYALRVHRGAESVVVLIAFGCTMWRFVGGGEDRQEDFDPVNDRLVAIVETVFKLD